MLVNFEVMIKNEYKNSEWEKNEKEYIWHVMAFSPECSILEYGTRWLQVQKRQRKAKSMPRNHEKYFIYFLNIKTMSLTSKLIRNEWNIMYDNKPLKTRKYRERIKVFHKFKDLSRKYTWPSLMEVAMHVILNWCILTI